MSRGDLHRLIRLIPFLLTSAFLQAATIRGTVVENQTGRALSRASIELHPVPGTTAAGRVVRTDVYGGFQFAAVAPGAYVVKASKRGFMSIEYGQKRWNSAGVPVVVTIDASPFLTLRLPHYASVSGAVLDENDVGLPDQGVVAYRATQPPQLAGRATTDDRGVYRISGLEPGQYLLRTSGHTDDVAEYLATFSKQTLRVEEAVPVQAFLEEDSKGVDIRPVSGKLFTLTGSAVPSPESAGPVHVTLASDMGRQRTIGPKFEFKSLPPGRYELYAEVTSPVFQAAYVNLTIQRDTIHGMFLQPVRETRFDFTPAVQGTEVLARRIDHAGVHESEALKLKNNTVLLGPGRWQFLVTPPVGHYVSGFSSPFGATKTRPDGWNDALLSSVTVLRVTLATGSGSVSGSVKSAGESVAGAPVFVEPYDPNTRQRLGEPRIARTDLQGTYRFDGLAPGSYRILSTFEYYAPDAGVMDVPEARTLRIDAQTSAQTPLDLYVIR